MASPIHASDHSSASRLETRCGPLLRMTSRSTARAATTKTANTVHMKGVAMVSTAGSGRRSTAGTRDIPELG